ncbi:MAG: DUF3631 domain-containing protein [Gemmatimonadetes bacterium]|nr:DUF3631 domain-containing protein [Gemmatimonadota bacterium]
MTHALDAFDCAVYLHITSPMPECGKTRLLEVLELLVAKPWLTGRITAAVLMRKMDAEHPTLLLDESDAAFNSNPEYSEALRGMLNSGFRRPGNVSVCIGQGSKITYKDFSTFGPKAIAGIGRLPSTVESRSIPIRLKRRRSDERVDKLRLRDAAADCSRVHTALASALAPFFSSLQSARPDFPPGLSDRAEDVLEPLLAIADSAGGDWPDRARAAVAALIGNGAREKQEAEQDVALQLLGDLQALFKERGSPEFLWTKDIVTGLAAIGDRPWAEYGRKGDAINSHAVARLLKKFDVQPAGTIRDGIETAKGYRLASLEDAFERYLPAGQTPQASQRHKTNNNG